MADGIITRKRIIEDDGLNWGENYAVNVKKAIDANDAFAASTLQIFNANEKLRRSENQTEYLKQKNEVKLAIDRANASIKEQEQLERSLEKIKQEAINTQKKQIELDSKVETQKKKNVTLTIEERVQNEVNNKALRQQAREQLGLVGAYEKLNKQRSDAQRKLADLLAAENKNVSAIKAAQKEYDKLNERVRRVDAATDNYTKTIGNYKTAFSGLRGIASDLIAGFGVLTGVQLFVGAVQNIFAVTKELQSLDLALLSVTGSQQNFNEQQQFLNRIAKENGLEIKNLTSLYTKFYVAAKDKLSGNEIQQIFEDIAKSGSALGLSNETLERSFTALNQMLSKGTVQSEELRGQLAESLPGAIQAMVAATKKLHPELKQLTEKEFFEMVKAGKILANEVLPETAKQLLIITGADKATGIETLTKATNRLSNEWTDFVRTIGEGDSALAKFATGGISLLAGLTQGLRNAFESAEQERSRILRELQEKSYKESIDAFKGFSETELKTAKQYNGQKIQENASTIEQLTLQNNSYREKLKSQLSILDRDELNASREKNKKKIEDLNSYSTKLIGQNKAIGKLLEESALKTPGAVGESDADRKKRLDKLKKETDEYLKLLQKRNDDEAALQAFRYEREIYYNQLIVDNDKASANDRIDAFLNIEQLKKSATDEALQYELQAINLSKIEELKKNAELTGSAEQFTKTKIDALVKASDAEIALAIKTGKLKEGATNAEVLAFEKYLLKVQQITQSSEDNRQKIIDSEAGKIQKIIDAQLQSQDTNLNKALAYQNELYKEGVQSLEETEKKKKEIRERYAKDALQLQIDEYTAELQGNSEKEKSTQLSAEKVAEIQNKLSKLKLELGAVDVQNAQEVADKILEINQQNADRLKRLQEELGSAIIDLVNTLFDAKIAKIDQEISASNDYYDNEIAKAGDDQRKKDDLEKLKEKKQQELEAKRRREMVKAAIFNKVISLAQIGTDLAKTLVAINLAARMLDTISFGTAGLPYQGLQTGLAIGLAAIQTANVLATPLPKYKRGKRKGEGRDGLAIVDDGGVPEVIERTDGSIELGSNKPRITHLKQDDIVHSSYQEYLRNSMLNSIGKNQSRIELTAKNVAKMTDKELLEELKRNTTAIKNQKTLINLQSPKVDYEHLGWAFRNTNWR